MKPRKIHTSHNVRLHHNIIEFSSTKVERILLYSSAAIESSNINTYINIRPSMTNILSSNINNFDRYYKSKKDHVL